MFLIALFYKHNKWHQKEKQHQTLYVMLEFLRAPGDRGSPSWMARGSCTYGKAWLTGIVVLVTACLPSVYFIYLSVMWR